MRYTTTKQKKSKLELLKKMLTVIDGSRAFLVILFFTFDLSGKWLGTRVLNRWLSEGRERG